MKCTDYIYGVAQPSLNLKKELDHKVNEAITDTWKVEKVLTEDVQIYVPPTDEAKKSEELTEKDFKAPPYSKISLDKIEVCDIVSTGENVRGYYEVYQHCGDHVLGRCLYHDSLKMRIGQDGYYIKVPYLVEKALSEEGAEVIAAPSSDSLYEAPSSRRIKEAA